VALSAGPSTRQPAPAPRMSCPLDASSRKEKPHVREPPLPSSPPHRPFSRRDFLRLGVGTAALSLSAAEALNAAVYESVDGLCRRLTDQDSPDGAFWEALRKHYLFEDGLIMMNNGTVGPMPEPVFNTLMSSFHVQCAAPCEVYNTFGTRREEVRRKVARFVGADPGEIVLTRNTTEGMNFVANGLDLEPGDEILMSDMEHPGGIHPWRLKAARQGVTIREVPIGLPPPPWKRSWTDSRPPSPPGPRSSASATRSTSRASSLPSRNWRRWPTGTGSWCWPIAPTGRAC
jgi:hypothetical protein